ncbi:hypothetical protein ZOSMA_69G00890 [Zostera marina]|uniref:KAT8 regulatory NSL complex subunit 2 n=1 Tax=Zostera marina TaxID=29655 RepID=A0A0K9NRJ0_ZOSMR|nr:hypothetical protein ZOSMA_69G00890 [Zostera marina]
MGGSTGTGTATNNQSPMVPPPAMVLSKAAPKRTSNETSSMQLPPLHPTPSQSQSPVAENPRNLISRPDSVSYDSIPIDGSNEDELLRHSNILSREEVLRRRSRRLKQLARIYRNQYWALMEEIRQRHREYYWRYGKGPMMDVEERDAEVRGGGLEVGFGRGEKKRKGENLVDFPVCMFSGCKTKAMALTTYCFQHILSDQRQTLYKPCTYVIKSAQSGPIVCGKPVLKTAVPSLCPVHFQRAQRHVIQALKKAGLNTSSSSWLAPKFHVIISEAVQHIEAKRIKIQRIEKLNDTCNKDKHVI